MDHLPDLAERGHHILYAAHLGIAHVKALASSFVQWPGTDSDIGRIIKQYCTCQAAQHNSERETKHLDQ